MEDWKTGRLGVVFCSISEINREQPTVNRQSSIVNRQPSSANRQPSIVNCQPLTVNCEPPPVNPTISRNNINKNKMADEIKGIFIHHVYFWLAEPDNAHHKKLLIDGLKKLSSVKTIQRFHIGEPANTSREVIDSSYSVSWILIFNNAADQDSYQTDLIHLRFVEECKRLWKRVQVYDTIDV